MLMANVSMSDQGSAPFRHADLVPPVPTERINRSDDCFCVERPRIVWGQSPIGLLDIEDKVTPLTFWAQCFHCDLG
jgi:hypothetical protein